MERRLNSALGSNRGAKPQSRKSSPSCQVKPSQMRLDSKQTGKPSRLSHSSGAGQSSSSAAPDVAPERRKRKHTPIPLPSEVLISNREQADSKEEGEASPHGAAGRFESPWASAQQAKRRSADAHKAVMKGPLEGEGVMSRQRQEKASTMSGVASQKEGSRPQASKDGASSPARDTKINANYPQVTVQQRDGHMRPESQQEAVSAADNRAANNGLPSGVTESPLKQRHLNRRSSSEAEDPGEGIVDPQGGLHVREDIPAKGPAKAAAASFDFGANFVPLF